MDAQGILSLFGTSANGSEIEALLASLNTLHKPVLPDDEEFVYHDWVLVRRKGVELGFSDSEYHKAAHRALWGRGKLLLTQAYFYAGFDTVRPFTGKLPHGLTFDDDRDRVRAKLAAFEATRHSYRSDTWDVAGYRLNIVYKEKGQGIDRMACRVLAAPIPDGQMHSPPGLATVVAAFGADVRTAEFALLWGGLLDKKKLQESIEEGEINFTQDYGAVLGLACSGSAVALRSVTLHRNRDRESRGWKGDMPNRLDFEDSPEVLFTKIKERPVQQSDSQLTGHAVWHFEDYTLHVLYSNLDNRLLRVKLIAPGTWKCIEDG